MSKPKHTPGPWQQVNLEPVQAHRYSFDGTPVDRVYVARIYAGGERTEIRVETCFSQSEAEANAKLIAAAPEMAEALRLLLAQAEMSCDWDTDVIRQSQAALAKAGTNE